MKLKFFIAIALTALLSFSIGLFTLPWYCFVITSLVIAILIPQKPSKAFLAAFVGVGVLWLIIMVITDVQNSHILSSKIAEMFMLKGNSSLLIIISCLIGALLSGLGGLTGSLLRSVVKK